MELVHILRQLWKLRIWVALVTVLAVGAALLTSFKPSGGFPPTLEKNSLSFGAAQVQILVDSPRSSLSVLGVDPTPLVIRAKVYAQFMASVTAKKSIAAESGIPFSQIKAQGPFSSQASRENYQVKEAEPRGKELLEQGSGYSLLFEVLEDLPVISVSTQAPTAAEALTLANAAAKSLNGYVDKLEKEVIPDLSQEDLRQLQRESKKQVPATTGVPVPDLESVRPNQRVTIRQLGPAEGGTVNAGIDLPIMIFAFLAAFVAGCIAILAISGLVRNWRRVEAEERLGGGALIRTSDPVVPGSGNGGAYVETPTSAARPVPASELAYYGVESILNAAEQAAERILDDARAEAGGGNGGSNGGGNGGKPNGHGTQHLLGPPDSSETDERLRS